MIRTKLRSQKQRNRENYCEVLRRSNMWSRYEHSGVKNFFFITIRNNAHKRCTGFMEENYLDAAMHRSVNLIVY